MNRRSRKLTLDESVTYEIKVYGQLEAEWSDWGCRTEIAVTDQAGVPISIISGGFDQAALHGLLRRLYLHGFPLISVQWSPEHEH